MAGNGLGQLIHLRCLLSPRAVTVWSQAGLDDVVTSNERAAAPMWPDPRKPSTVTKSAIIITLARLRREWMSSNPVPHSRARLLRKAMTSRTTSALLFPRALMEMRDSTTTTVGSSS